jgi:hypothetical protein
MGLKFKEPNIEANIRQGLMFSPFDPNIELLSS